MKKSILFSLLCVFCVLNTIFVHRNYNLIEGNLLLVKETEDMRRCIDTISGDIFHKNNENWTMQIRVDSLFKSEIEKLSGDTIRLRLKY